MKVGDGFAGMGAVVDDEAVAVFVEAELARDVRSFEKEVSENSLVFGGGFVDARNGFARDDKDVGGRGGADVAKRENLVVFVNDVSGDFAISDFLEQRLAHKREHSEEVADEKSICERMRRNTRD